MKNTDKEQLLPKNQINISPHLKQSVKLLDESSKMNVKYARPSCSNDVLWIMLKDLFMKPFSNEAEFQISLTEVVYQNFYMVAIGQPMDFISHIL